PTPELLRADVIVVGGGAAGMMAALHASSRRVILLADRQVGRSGSTFLAQGGVAAALGPGDSPERHAEDTVRAADGLADPAVVRMVTREGPRRIHEILELGARFDRNGSGGLSLGREGAHSVRRIVHARGDATGAELARTLAEAVRRRETIRILEGFGAEAVLELDGTVLGLAATAPDGSPLLLAAPAVVLATGGLGHLFRRTTNPPEARGTGLALAARAGAELADLEMVQFHPTALADGSDPAPLLTEALRGEGAVLVDEEGRRVMAGVHPAGDLAPRDVVARTLWRLQSEGHRIFLDATAIGPALKRRFPTVSDLCRRRGLDPAVEPIPVAPAAHYHMGGIVVDSHGRSTVRGLWAVGEVACTGLHGANRLASNSLLEALVFGARAGDETASLLAAVPPEGEVRAARKKLAAAGVATGAGGRNRVAQELRDLLWESAGVERDAAGLRRGLERLDRLADHDPGSASVEVARWILRSALERRSSRGAHLRTDADPADDGLYRVVIRGGRVRRERPAWLRAAVAGRANVGV
ncbi:MAG TPA: L-aspartate oxidase, partial [Acidobacteria bacterium]|nr:L-aspartate oxidase [Acidobacteriota bacterium]